MCHPLRTRYLCSHTKTTGTACCYYFHRLEAFDRTDRRKLNVSGRAMMKAGCDRDADTGQLVMDLVDELCERCKAEKKRREKEGNPRCESPEKKRFEEVRRTWLEREQYASDRERLGGFADGFVARK